MDALAEHLRFLAAFDDTSGNYLIEAAARIEALEAALRKCAQYHIQAAADCRAISAVNQDNRLGADSLTHAIDHDIAAEDIGEIVRAALDPATPQRSAERLRAAESGFAGRNKDAGK